MAQEKEERQSRSVDGRRVLRVDRRVNDSTAAKREDDLGLPLPDRRKVYNGERREKEEKRRIIEIVPERPIHTCIYVENFQFHECTIRTCKNFTDVTRTKCLAIDRVQPVGNKIISDAELHLYKFSQEKVSTRLISIKRKKAITRVKAILILHSFIEYIRENHKPKGVRVYGGKLVERLEMDYPLKVRKLQFYNWMWPYLTSKKVWRKFALKKGGECAVFKVYMLLNLTRMKYDSLITQLKEDQHERSIEASSPQQSDDDRRTRKLQKLVSLGTQQLKPKRKRKHDHE